MLRLYMFHITSRHIRNIICDTFMMYMWNASILRYQSALSALSIWSTSRLRSFERIAEKTTVMCKKEVIVIDVISLCTSVISVIIDSSKAKGISRRTFSEISNRLLRNGMNHKRDATFSKKQVWDRPNNRSIRDF